MYRNILWRGAPEDVSPTKGKGGVYKGKSHKASQGNMMGQFKQVLGLSVQDWLVVVRLGVSKAELRVPSLSLDSIVTGSHQALLTLISFLGSSFSGSFFRGPHCC